MFRKIWNYQNILCKSLTKESSHGILVFIFIPLAVDIFSGYQMWLTEWLCLALCCLGAELIENNSSRMRKILPVSDKFAVANMLFGFPLYIGSLSFAGIFVVLGILQVVFEMVIEGRFQDFSGIVVSIHDILGVVFSLLIYMSIWFWMCLGAFHKDTKLRRCWYIAEAVVCIAGIWILDTVLESMGIQVEFALADLPSVFPVVPTMLAGLLFAFVSGVIAWNGSLRLYRGDTKGQRHTLDMQDKMEEQCLNRVSNDITKTGKLKKRVGILLAIGIVVFCMFSIMFVGTSILDTGEIQKVDITTSNPSEYSDWDSYAQEMDVDAEIMETGELIFPDNMNTKYIDEYFAKLDGNFEIYEDGYASSISGLRFMVATLPEEEYQKEKVRLAGISVTCKDESVENNVNRILHDTEHFPLEAYIAVYEEGLEYEYALTDDEDKQIIYVFAYDALLKDIPTEMDFCANIGTDVISILQANTDMKGFSVYSFGDEEMEFYFTDIP